ncbi:Predicted arabinose efflux permease, MFS family [Alteromonadaceae bacterium Bs31]|nr:Predicted arabinose efflux permease, MFS family [Alteromonadaceae bacterium Bs31]
MLGLFMVLPVLMLYGSDYRGASPALLGLALGIYGLTQAVFQIPLGLLSDIFGRKPVIATGLLIFAIGSVVAASAETVEGLILGRALQGSGAIASAIMAMVADLTSEQNRTKAMAAIGASIGLSFSVAMFLGPAVAGFAGLSGVFGLSAVLALFGLVVLVFLPTPPAHSSHRDSGAIPALIISCLRDGQLLRLNWGIFCLHFVLMAAFVVVPNTLEAQLGIARSAHWKVYLFIMLTAFVLMLPLVLIAERKRRIKTVFLFAIAILCASLAVLSTVELTKWGWLAVLLLFFTAFNLLEANLPSLVSKEASAGAKGTAMGVYSTSQFLGAFAGGIAGGGLMQHYGQEQVFMAGAVLTLCWLLVAASMRGPRYLSSVCVAVSDGNANMDVLAVPGVEEALFATEEKLLYLKVDKRTFDEQALKALLGASEITESPETARK